MKKLIALFLILSMLFGCFAFADVEGSEESPLLENDLYILFTSDVHCGVNSGWTYAGLDYIREKLLADGYHVFLVDNGDSVQGEPLGTMTKGELIITLMNAMGYDLATIGNHEFGYGMDQFLKLTEMADFNYVSCNFNHKGQLCFEPYYIFEADNAKIAFVGVTTPETLTSSAPKNFKDETGEYVYGFCQDETGKCVYDAVQSAVDAARAEGADYVVLMAHLGSEESCRPWTYADVIENTTGIDAVLDGHSHDLEKVSMLNKDGKKTLRQGCGTKLEGIGYLKISTDGSIDTGVWRWENDISLPDLLGITSDMTDALNNASAKLNEALSEVVATSIVDLKINDDTTGVRIVRNQETNIGNLCADAYLWNSGADIGLINGGCIRTGIPAGNLTLNDILTVHPFGNMLCVCEATGQEILDALEFGASAWPGEFGGWLCPAGFSYEIHTYIDSTVTKNSDGLFTGVAGERRVKNVMIGNEPLDPEKTYTVTSHNGLLQEMVDGYTMFADNVFLQNCVKLDNQVLIDYIVGGLSGVVGEEYAEPRGRIVFVDEPPVNR